MNLDDFTASAGMRDRRYYIDNLNHGIGFNCMHFKVARGNNLGTFNFTWDISNGLSDHEFRVNIC